MREGRHLKLAETQRHAVADLIARDVQDVPPKQSHMDRIQQPAQLCRWRAELGRLVLPQ